VVKVEFPITFFAAVPALHARQRLSELTLIFTNYSLGIYRCCGFPELKAMQSVHRSPEESRFNAIYAILIVFIECMLQMLDRNGKIDKCDLITGVIWCHAP
jgi:hypothetical protein